MDRCRKINVSGNIAYGKPAVQTGFWTEGGKDLTADLAVDGRLYEGSNNYCAHPYTLDGTPAQWTVDLQNNYQLYNVTIYNSGNPGGTIPTEYTVTTASY